MHQLLYDFTFVAPSGVAEVLVEQVFEFFLRAKWDEWHDYTAQITPWEIDTGIDL